MAAPVSPAMFSPIPFPGWAPQLLTGNPELDSEHRLLLNAMARLREVCTELDRQAADISAGNSADIGVEPVIDVLGDLLAFLVDHFYAEEKLMKKFGLTLYDKQLCDRHKEDHAAISDAVLRIVSNLDQSQTVPLIRQLQSVLQDWLERHIEIHDVMLVRMLGQR